MEEYEKIRDEKRKALLALKTEERKVEIDNELKSMQQLSLKKRTDDVFIKLVSLMFLIVKLPSSAIYGAKQAVLAIYHRLSDKFILIRVLTRRRRKILTRTKGSRRWVTFAFIFALYFCLQHIHLFFFVCK